MTGNSDLWINFWSKEKYAYDYSCGERYGTSWEPDSSVWCACFFEAVKDMLDKPFVVLDWGAGDGRFFAFLCRRYEDFSYYGFEIKTNHGIYSVDRARSFFGSDKRFHFDFVDSPLVQEATRKANIITLGSVATHLTLSKSTEYLDKFKPAFDRGAAMVASYFFGEPKLVQPGIYESEDCYGYTIISFDEFQDCVVSRGLVAEKKEEFSSCGLMHNVMRIQSTTLVNEELLARQEENGRFGN